MISVQSGLTEGRVEKDGEVEEEEEEEEEEQRNWCNTKFCAGIDFKQILQTSIPLLV